MGAADLLAACPWVTYRQLDHWTRRGWLHPRRVPVPVGAPTDGPGVPRLWPPREAQVARIMAALVRAGLTPAAAAAGARAAVLDPDGRTFLAPLPGGVSAEGALGP